ncbi:MAG: hypothetical protein U0V87_15665 [Acidobacteriota bacterium]
MNKRLLVVLTMLAGLAVAVPAFADTPGKIGDTQHRAWKLGATDIFATECSGSVDVALAASPSATFCDGSARAGTSKSCKAWGKANPAAAPSISCPAGSTIANLNCSPYSNKQCASGYGCDCTWECHKATVADPVPEEV